MNNTPYLNIGEVAEYLKLSRETLYKYVQRGLIPAIKIGRHWRFHRESLDSWLNQQVKDSGQPEPAYLVPPLTHSRPNLPLNVLVVDDDPSIRLILRVWMRAAGHHVELAENGLAAMQHLTSKSFDLAFLDLQMPDITGGQVLGRMQEYENQPAVVLITAYGGTPLMEQALQYDILYILSKPFTRDQVSKILLSVQATRIPEPVETKSVTGNPENALVT